MAPDSSSRMARTTTAAPGCALACKAWQARVAYMRHVRARLAPGRGTHQPIICVVCTWYSPAAIADQNIVKLANIQPPG